MENLQVLPFGDDVRSISGWGTSFGASAYSPEFIGGGVSADFSLGEKVQLIGFTLSLGMGTPGASVGTSGLTQTFATLFSKSDYQALFDTDYDEMAMNQVRSWNAKEADLAVLQGLSRSDVRGSWRYTGMEMQYSKQKDGSYKVNYKLNYYYSTTGRGASEGVKDTVTSQTINTGVEMKQKDKNTLQSTNLK